MNPNPWGKNQYTTIVQVNRYTAAETECVNIQDHVWSESSPSIWTCAPHQRTHRPPEPHAGQGWTSQWGLQVPDLLEVPGEWWVEARSIVSQIGESEKPRQRLTELMEMPGVFYKHRGSFTHELYVDINGNPPYGASGWLSWLSVRFWLRSWSHSLWVWALCRALCWQLRAWRLPHILILCLLSLSSPCLLIVCLSLSHKNK